MELLFLGIGFMAGVIVSFGILYFMFREFFGDLYNLFDVYLEDKPNLDLGGDK
jgi:hypothetical protein